MANEAEAQAADAEFRDRAAETLHAAKPGDLIVVALISHDGGAVIHIANPNARRLTDLAASLLDQAADLLRDAHEDGSVLAQAIDDALGCLPDRFDDGEG